MSENKEEIISSFNTLKEGGTVAMELQETFWSKNYGYEQISLEFCGNLTWVVEEIS